MDISGILQHTIHHLSQPHPENEHRPGEFVMTGMDTISGGTEASAEDIERMLTALNTAASKVDGRVSFAYSDKIGRVVMKITDPDTGDIVRQVPSKEMVSLLEHIQDLLGMFVDEQR